ncbi:hypothetical protein [Neobacillus sp. PS3-40]|uniref:hypothetical protein n=1 Tax=Neobacillus sp. PS3-40 TaxID=3070679 RepID=UPI0027E03E17|nr:hypothetical protein [Neobacillus sp. PS3-40]WML46143.1 hypothetical protein RCG20_09735 [Neobacillus sp. PS3-40]
MFFFNKEEIHIGYSMEELSRVRGILESKGIKYIYKVINRSSQWLGQGTTRGNFGSTGMNSNYETQYVVSVKKKDSENAKYWVNTVLHP